MDKKKTHSVEPEFSKGCVVKLKDPFGDRYFADIGVTVFFVSFS